MDLSSIRSSVNELAADSVDKCSKDYFWFPRIHEFYKLKARRICYSLWNLVGINACYLISLGVVKYSCWNEVQVSFLWIKHFVSSLVMRWDQVKVLTLIRLRGNFASKLLWQYRIAFKQCLYWLILYFPEKCKLIKILHIR